MRAVAWGFVALAAVLLVLAVLTALRGLRRRRWPSTEGRVTGIDVEPGGENGTFEFVLVAYRGGDGVERTHRASRRAEEVGDTVAVRVHPARPERAVLSGTELRLTWALLVGTVLSLGVARFCVWVIDETSR